MKRWMLSVSLTEEEREEMAVRCHFDRAELPKISAFYEAVLPLVRAQACFCMAAPERAGEKAALCAVSLGQKFDALQELYSSVEAVSEAYILECIGNMLLEKACERLADILGRETGLFPETCRFPGSHMPIEEMGDMIKELSAGEKDFFITCSESYCLQPKKSVIYLGILGKCKTERHMCEDCPKKDCENRRQNYNYGYQKIFGREEKRETL